MTTSTAHQWVANQRARLEDRVVKLADQHGALTLPANPAVNVWADEKCCLYISVGTNKRHGTHPDAFWTGTRLTARISPNDVIALCDVSRSTYGYSSLDERPLKAGGLRGSMDAQQVLDRLVSLIGTDQCCVCGRHGDHLHGTDEAPYCDACCPDPDCNPEEGA